MSLKTLALALIVILPLASSSVFSNQHLPKTLVMTLLAAVAIGDWLQDCWRHKRLRLALGWINLGWLLFFVWTCLSSTGVSDWTRGSQRLCYWLMLLILHLWFASRSSEDLAHYLWLLVIGGTMAAAYGLYQALAPRYLHSYPTFVATFGNINFAAAYMAMVLPLALYCGPRKSLIVWIVRPLACGLLFSYLIKTGSRAAWLASVIGFAAYALSRLITGWKWPGLKKALAVSSLAIVIIALPLSHANWRRQVIDRLVELKDFDRGSVKVRKALWQATAKMIGQHPWMGVGPGQFAHHFYRYRQPEEYVISHGRLVDHPHDSWLLIAAESGIPAALALAAMLLIAIVTAWRLARQRQDDNCHLPSPGLLAVLVTLSIISLVSSPLLSPASAIFLVIGSGWAAQQSLSRRWEIALGFRGQCLTTIAGALAILLLLSGPVRHSLADIQAVSGQRCLKQGQFAQAATKLSQAVVIYPECLYQVELARAMLAAKDYRLARKLFAEVRDRAPELENAHIDLGLCYIKSDQEYQAFRVWSEAYQWFPASPTLNINLARLVLRYALAKELFLLEHRPRAFAIFQEPVAAEASAQSLLQRGLAYEAAGNLRKALVCYIDAKDDKKLQAITALQIGLAMQQSGLESSAFHHLMQAVGQGDKKIVAAAYCVLGSMFQTRQKQLALTYYLKAGQADRSNPEPYLYMAQIAWQSKRKDITGKFLQHAQESGFVFWEALARHPFFQALTTSNLYLEFRRRQPIRR